MTQQYLPFVFMLFSCTYAFVRGMGVEVPNDIFNENDLMIEEEEERLFVIPAITLNISTLSTALPIALALATSLASLLATVALAAVVFSLFGKYKYDGYGGGHSGYGGTGGYTSYSTSSYRAIFDPNVIDWEKYSILDLIAVGEEIWSKFDPSDLNCQKRLICEIHQNEASLGFAAEKIVQIFGYLTYAKSAILPEEIEALVDEFLDAADKGLTKKEDCGDMFPDCKFSVKKIAAKYSKNEV